MDFKKMREETTTLPFGFTQVDSVTVIDKTVEWLDVEIYYKEIRFVEISLLEYEKI